MKLAVLAGGVGGARFVQALTEVVPAEDVTVIANVGDDLEVQGLHVSPDLDTLLYTLAGLADEERGWGRAGETWNARDTIERQEEGLPHRALARENLPSGRGQLVVAPPPLARALDPSTVDEALVLEPVQRGIERRDVEVDGAVRPLFDEPADLVAVARTLLEQRQDQDFSATALQLAFKERRGHMWPQHICGLGVVSIRSGRRGSNPQGLNLCVSVSSAAESLPPW